MKKLYFLVVVLFVVGSVKGQIINFPDANFKARLLSPNYGSNVALDLDGNYLEIDANNNDEIEESEALQVGFLQIYPPYNTTFTSFEGIEYFTNLTVFSSEQYTGTTANFSSLVNLETLLISAPYMTNINVNGLVNLKIFDCFNCQLTSIDVSTLTSLEGLSVLNSQLSSINLTGLVNLQEMSVSGNNLTTLDLSQQPNLTKLDCSDNELTSLEIPNESLLEYLDCNNNPLGNLNLADLSNLVVLWCNNIGLTTFDATPLPLLQSLSCSFNQINSLNVVGMSNLIHLSCDFNQLTSLDLTGLSSLNTIYCGYNLLQTLDLSQLISLENLSCSENQLISLNCKNGKVEAQFYLQDNPNLEYICADEEMIQTIKLYTEYLGLNCEVNSYCSFTPGGAFYTIEGDNKFDTNNNGCDAQDIVYPNLKLALTGDIDTGIMISDTSGHYTYTIQAGTYTLAPVFENPEYFTVTPASTTIAFPAESTTINQNFCISANQIYSDLEVVIVPTIPACPGFNTNYKLIIKNKGNTQQSGLISFVYDDTVLDYVIAEPVYTTQASGSLTWDFINLEPFETREINVTLNVNTPMETPAVNGGDVLTYNATITSDQVDELPLDNTFTLPQIVVNSFDPNDKTCLEGTSITPDMIGKYVHYMIRFENTGTFAAQNIVVKDMIDTAKFDVSSLVALNGSHSYVTRITGNKVEFIFENINLPFDDANNDGYVVFKIKTLPTLVLGDSFSNSASIYFDYNFPIVTDPAVTTFAVLGTEDFEFNNYFALYPNPTNGVLNITSKQAIGLQSISIYNTLGQMVVSVPNAKGISSVDVSGLATGNYFIKIVSDKGTSNAKFIKE